MLPATEHDFINCIGNGPCFFIGTYCGKGIKHIGDSYDPAIKRDICLLNYWPTGKHQKICHYIYRSVLYGGLASPRMTDYGCRTPPATNSFLIYLREIKLLRSQYPQFFSGTLVALDSEKKETQMAIEQIPPVNIVDVPTQVYSQAVADESLATFLADEKAVKVAQAAEDAKVAAAKVAQTAKDNKADEAKAFQQAKETREKAQAAKNARMDAAEAYQETKDAGKAAQKAKYAKMDAATLEENKAIMEKTLAAKTDQKEASRRAAKSAASNTADVSAQVNSKAEADQAIESYQENRAAQEVAQESKSVEAARLAEAGITADAQSRAVATTHIDIRD